MEKKQLLEFLGGLSPYSLLVVNSEGKILEVFCPFKVEVISSIGELKIGAFVLVDKVMVSNDLKVVFLICDIAYFYYYFDIEI